VTLIVLFYEGSDKKDHVTTFVVELLDKSRHVILFVAQMIDFSGS